MTGNKKSPSPAPVAGNGLLDRRLFLQGGVALGTAQLVAGNVQAVAARPESMSVPGEPFTPYGQPAQFEEEVVRYPAPNRVLRNNGASWTPLHRLEGMITPNGLHYERHHNGVPQINPDEHRLLVHGPGAATGIFQHRQPVALPDAVTDLFCRVRRQQQRGLE